MSSNSRALITSTVLGHYEKANNDKWVLLGNLYDESAGGWLIEVIAKGPGNTFRLQEKRLPAGDFSKDQAVAIFESFKVAPILEEVFLGLKAQVGL